MINLICPIKSENKRIFNRRILLIVSAVVLIIPAIVLLGAPKNIFSDIALFIGLWSLIALCCLFLAARWSFSAKLGGTIDILEIPIYLSVTSLFLINLCGLAPFFDENYLLPGLYSPAEISWGLLLTGVGLISLWLGYIVVGQLSRYRIAAPRKSGYGLFFDNPSLPLTLFIYFALIVFRILLFFRGGGEAFFSGTDHNQRLFGDFKQWIVFLVESRWFFIALITLQVAKKRWPLWLFVSVICIEIGMAAVSGWAGTFITLFILILGCLLYCNQRLSTVTLVSLIILIILMVPITRSMRKLGGRSPGQVISYAQKESKTYWGNKDRKGMDFVENLLIGRQSATAQVPAVIMNLTPSDIPYRSADELLLAPLSFVPRILWPGKPVYANLQRLVTRTYLGSRSEGSAAVTMVGNAYIYGGWVMVVICMFALGVISGLIYINLALPGLTHGQVGLLAVYAGSIIANLGLGEGDFSSLCQGFVQRIAVFLCLAVIICWNSSRVTRSMSNVTKKRISTAI